MTNQLRDGRLKAVVLCRITTVLCDCCGQVPLLVQRCPSEALEWVLTLHISLLCQIVFIYVSLLLFLFVYIFILSIYIFFILIISVCSLGAILGLEDCMSGG